MEATLCYSRKGHFLIFGDGITRGRISHNMSEMLVCVYIARSTSEFPIEKTKSINIITNYIYIFIIWECINYCWFKLQFLQNLR